MIFWCHWRSGNLPSSDAGECQSALVGIEIFCPLLLNLGKLRIADQLTPDVPLQFEQPLYQRRRSLDTALAGYREWSLSDSSLQRLLSFAPALRIGCSSPAFSRAILVKR